jgi:hypothetical protein
MGAASKACLDVPKAFPKGDLREDHGEELVSAVMDLLIRYMG